jgi:hypothetical protein
MTNVMIAGLLLMIVMVQVLYLESLQRFRKILLAAFSLILACFFYYFLADPLEKLNVAQWLMPAQQTEKTMGNVVNVIHEKAEKQGDGEYTQLYVEAFLAYEQQHYDIALIYFGRLYALRPDDMSYYPAFANTLLLVDPRNPLVHTLVAAVKANPERDLGIWLLFAHYEEVVHGPVKAKQYYEEALKLVDKGSPMYRAIKER